MPVKLNSFTPVRALLVLHDCDIFWPKQLASLGIIPIFYYYVHDSYVHDYYVQIDGRGSCKEG
jgi:hypothetical protein